MTAFACYRLENVRTVGYEVLVNRPKTAAYRAPSAPMAAFAVESAVDELAKKIGMDRSSSGSRTPRRKAQDRPMARSTARSASARHWKRRRTIRT